jgi:hydrogenase maturation protease
VNTLILGLGNAILCDDGVGIKAARYIAEQGAPPGVVVKEAELAGFALIDLLEGFDRAVVIDAVKLRGGAPGEIVVFASDAIAPSLHLVAAHQIDLPTALEMGRRLGRPVPSVVHIVGVEIEDDTTFSESCTPAVEASIPAAAREALRLAMADPS